MKIPESFLSRRQTAANSTIAINFVHPKISIEDAYYMPISVSSPEVYLRTIVSNRDSQTWIPIKQACEVIGPNAAAPLKDFLDSCADGQILDPDTSTTITQSTSGIFDKQDKDEQYYAKGGTGSDTIRIGGVELANFDMNFVTETNTSFAHVGLGQESTLLTRLKDEGHIAARAFSMFVGSDVSYSQDWDPNARNASYPGSIVFGGYDFKKEGDSFLRGDLVSGMPRVSITGINVHNQNGVISVLSTPLEAEIDASNPWIYLPESVANLFRRARENRYNDAGETLSARFYGNVTMTVKLLSDNARVGVTEFNVSIPESVWEKDRSYFRRPIAEQRKYWPVLIKPAPAVLGMPFLKATYLAINYDSNEFQISPASYSSESEILPFVAVAADSSNRLESFPTRLGDSLSPTSTSSGGPGAPTSTSDNGPATKTSTGTIVGSAIGGVIALLGIVGLILFLVKKEKRKKLWIANQISSPTPGGEPIPPTTQNDTIFKSELPGIGRYSMIRGTGPSELPTGYYNNELQLHEFPASPVEREMMASQDTKDADPTLAVNRHELP